MPKTLEEIRRYGLDALRRRLGRAGMIRFLKQFSDGKGDYAKARHTWADKVSLEDIGKLARRQRRTRRSSVRG